MTPSSGQSSTGRFLSRISSIATPGEWSTFGRAKKPVSPGLTEFGEQPSAWLNRARGKDRAGSMRSSTTHNRSSQPSSGATPSKTPSRKSSDRHIDITNKENIDIPTKSDTQSPASTTPHSNNTSSSQSQSLSSRFARMSTPIARQLGFDSPHTFGNPSPHGRGRPDTSPPPPLPPLDHPELAAALLPRSHSLGGAPVILDCDAEGRLDPALFPPSKTYPPRTGHESRVRTRSNVESTGAETFGHAVRPSRSMPRAQSIFHSARQKHLSRSSPSGSKSSRAGSKSSPSGSKASRAPKMQGRRVSADLFSRQAAAGVTGSNVPAERESDWAARVSEEMIRLSLESSIAGEFGVISRSGTSGAGSRPGSAQNKGARGPTVPKSAGSASSSPSFPSTIPTIPPLSPSLFASFGLSGSPRNLSIEESGASAEKSRSDGLPNTSGVAGDHSFISWGTEDRKRPRSMQDQSRNAGKGSGSVTEKKTLRSSLKTRPANGGSSFSQSQRANEPIASSSKHADASSPLTIPFVSVTAPTSAEMTPTRLSRSLSDPSAFQTPIRSDSSKGKRKVEELDLTPPELKSIQKSTSFALPSDSRAGPAHVRLPKPHRAASRVRSPCALPARAQARTIIMAPSLIDGKFKKIISLLLKDLDAFARNGIKDELASLDPLLRNMGSAGSGFGDGRAAYDFEGV
ncbi:hypothetical protein EWM64_g2846 [Hericium alpestre]|uniref:Uncharacterized protein n=1 Tax=Hericium alpestre TaxID=135208 RepID=A0A4Z0A677_9AGAM|nr:hypothetical protein EWM64_g2846 [Hericium alpestre]